jgi:thiol-disulfide isomerase/thioredoxin
MSCLVVAVAALAGCGKDRDQGGAPEEPVDVSFSDLKKEFDEAVKKSSADGKKQLEAQKEAAQARLKAAQEKLRDAKTDEEKQAAQRAVGAAQQMQTMSAQLAQMGSSPATFAPRFLAFAEKNPKDPSAFESLQLALRTSGGPGNRNGIFLKAIAQIRANHATDPEIKKVIPGLGRFWDPGVQDLLREVVAKHSDRAVQTQACKELAASLNNAVNLAKQLKDKPDQAVVAGIQLGKEKIDKLIASLDKNRTEFEEVKRTLTEKFGVKIVERPPAKPSPAIGTLAPEVVSQNVKGEKVKLSDLRGKVVVLDIWATWCPPCRAMIPHEREMVARLKGRPFVLVSISGDEKKETLADFLAKEPMPWTHWWNGSQGGILADWGVQAFPTIYVLDAKGMIRYKDLRGDTLEEAVNTLLAEMEPKKSS